jgi:hypothetical protein
VISHPTATLANRAKQKKAMHPLFGTVSYFRPDPELFEVGIAAGEILGDHMMLTAGTTPGDMIGYLPLAGDVFLPICDVRLEAYGEAIDILGASRRLVPLLIRISADLQRQLDEQVPRHAAEHGIPIERLLEVNGHGVQLKLRIGRCVELIQP